MFILCSNSSRDVYNAYLFGPRTRLIGSASQANACSNRRFSKTLLTVELLSTVIDERCDDSAMWRRSWLRHKLSGPTPPGIQLRAAPSLAPDAGIAMPWKWHDVF